MSSEQPIDELRDDAGIGRARVLPRAKHVEVAQDDRLESIGIEEASAVELADILRDGIGGDWLRDEVLTMRQVRRVPIGRRRPRVDKATAARVAGRAEHVERPHRVGSLVQDRILKGLGDGDARAMVQDRVDALAGMLAVFGVSNVPFDDLDLILYGSEILSPA
jgi:hypothetical protein